MTNVFEFPSASTPGPAVLSRGVTKDFGGGGERIRVLRIHDFTTFDRIVTTVHEHLEIADAACAGRADAAAALMRVHVERSAAVVERRVGELLARMFEEERP